MGIQTQLPQSFSIRFQKLMDLLGPLFTLTLEPHVS